MGIKVITNKDGKLETVNTPDPDPYALDRLHREVKDMIEGNTQFHDDPFSKENQEKDIGVQLPEVTEGLPFDPDLWIQNNIYP